MAGERMKGHTTLIGICESGPSGFSPGAFLSGIGSGNGGGQTQNRQGLFSILLHSHYNRGLSGSSILFSTSKLNFAES